MSVDPLDSIRPAIIGIGAIATCATAVTVLGFGTQAPLAVVLLVAATLGAALAAICYYGIVRPLLTDIGAARTQHQIAQHQLVVARSRRHLLEQLDGSLDAAESEDQVIEVVGRALATLMSERDNAVLLAPPTGARVTWMIGAGPDGLGEPIILDRAAMCHALVDRHSHAVDVTGPADTCAHVDADDFEVSTLCVPIFVGEHHLGVAYSAGAPGDVPDDEAVHLLEVVARRSGARVAELRAARRHDYTLPLDAITQLPTQPLVLREIRQHLIDDEAFSIAVCDIDAFAPYNASHGTEVGDRALRSYADVLSATLRPTDVIARYEGDRFICVFPNCTALHAAAAMERVRETLILNIAMSEIEPFSVSVGIAGSSEATSTEELVDLAVTALGSAKVNGGNLVVRTETLDTFA